MAMSTTTLTLFVAAILFKTTIADANCPGVLHVDSGDASSCCVGGVIPPLTLSSCAGWPICTGPVGLLRALIEDCVI